MVQAPVTVARSAPPIEAGAVVRTTRVPGGHTLTWAVAGSLVLHLAVIGLALVPGRPRPAPPPERLLEVMLEPLPAAKPGHRKALLAGRHSVTPHTRTHLVRAAVTAHPAPAHPRQAPTYRAARPAKVTAVHYQPPIRPRPALPAAPTRAAANHPARDDRHVPPQASQPDTAPTNPPLANPGESTDEPNIDDAAAGANTTDTGPPDEDGGPLQTPNPPIPDAMKGAEAYELVVPVTVDVDAEGHVTQVTLNESSGNSDLDDAIVAAWRATPFKPRRHNGQAEAATHNYASRLQVDVKR